jgi:hypothetical protein
MLFTKLHYKEIVESGFNVKSVEIIREKYKISLCGLPDLQFTSCGIKTNLKVPMVCKKKTI